MNKKVFLFSLLFVMLFLLFGMIINVLVEENGEFCVGMEVGYVFFNWLQKNDVYGVVFI